MHPLSENEVEKEIDIIEKMRASGDFAKSLESTERLLLYASSETNKMRLLFNLTICAAQLQLDETLARVENELNGLPRPKESKIYFDEFRAIALIDNGNPQEALVILEKNLTSELINQDSNKLHKYDHLAYMGKALARLSRYKEAIAFFTSAQEMFADESVSINSDTVTHLRWMTTEILMEKSACLLHLREFKEAIQCATQLYERSEGEMRTLALHYMAMSKFSLRQWPDAIRLYAEIKSRLPCRLVGSDRIEEEMAECLAQVQQSEPTQ
jgi:tetratricopeptide (TPR) repeat protein